QRHFDYPLAPGDDREANGGEDFGDLPVENRQRLQELPRLDVCRPTVRVERLDETMQPVGRARSVTQLGPSQPGVRLPDDVGVGLCPFLASDRDEQCGDTAKSSYLLAGGRIGDGAG